MKYKYISKVFRQLKKYHLNDFIGGRDAIYNWLSTLSSRQIQNFLSLDIDFNSISFPLTILIDKNLLKCHDYKKRIESLSKLGKCQENIGLQKELCNRDFLNSGTFYQDIDALSKYGIPTISLSFLANEFFIKSKYHDEDLKLILTAKDRSVNGIDFLISSALVKIACDKNSINSKYHQIDMKIVFNCDSNCLQLDGCKEQYSVNNLAVNKISLSDKFHVDNMKLLTVNPIANQFLFKLMTDPKIIKDKKYRFKVGVIAMAKSRQTAIAMYIYIKKISEEEIKKYKIIDSNNINRETKELLMNTVRCDYDENFEKDVYSINYISDKCVIHYALLLINPQFRKSQYKKFDLHVLENIKDDEIFKDLVIYLHREELQTSIYHIEDINYISKTENSNIRKLLLEMASNSNSILSNTHEDDICYVFNLESKQLTNDIFKILSYYMLNPKGISDTKRGIILEKIKKLIDLNKINEISIYLNGTMEEDNLFDKNNVKLKMKYKSLCLTRAIFKKI